MRYTASSSRISRFSALFPAAILLIALFAGAAAAQSPTYQLGRTPTDAELHAWDHAVGPDGKELPPGGGNAVEGAQIYATKCSFCHGKNAEGIFPFPRLAGGVGTLNTPNPIRSSGSYLPFATTIWDFIDRAMPRDAEGTLTPNEIYAVTAFILFKNGTIHETDVLDRKTLPEVIMPNRFGFYPDPPQSAPDPERGWLPYWNHAPSLEETSPATPAAAVGGAGAPDNNPDVMAVDHSFVLALAKADKQAAEKMLDADCLWTNSAGETIGRAKVVEALPRNPLGDESEAEVSERTYGQAAAVQVASGKVHILRIWVKRAAGWRLLDFHEVTQRTGAAPPPGPTTNDCENPCKGVPYAAKNDAERGILKSWGELETAVTNHDPKGWSPHFLDEFVLISSNAAEPSPKSARLEQLAKPGFGPAPPQLAADPAVRFFHFGDTVVMIAQANPYAGKPAHISRIWVNREGMWRMAFSYQTTIQSAPSIVPPAS